MKRIAALLIVLGLAVTASFAQGPLSRVGPDYIATNYGKWNGQVVTGNAATGSQTIVVQSPVVTLPDGTQIIPFAVNVRIKINDGTNAETVTITAVSNCASGGLLATCAVTASFANTHGNSVPILSGTGGMDEALAAACAAGGGVVKLDTNTGVTTANIKNTAAGCSMVTIQDGRSGPAVYYALRPSAVTQIAAPSAPTVTVATGSLSSGAYLTKVAYVDALGGVSLASTEPSATATTTGIVIASPAASTGAVGWLPYMTAAGGSTNTEILAKATIDSTICTLSTLESVVPACAIGASATVTAANPSSTSKPVVESTAFTTFTYQPFNSTIPAPFNANYPFGVFVASATLNNSNADLAQFQTPAGYFNDLGHSWRVCVKGATATAVASSVLTVNLTASANYAQSPVTLSAIVFATQTRAAAGTFQGCWILTTSTTGSSGKFWVRDAGNFVEFLNSAPATQVVSADASAAASSAIDLTKQLWFAVNAAESGSQNLTGPIINSVTVEPWQ